jgi:hypothetical protein
MSETHDCTNCYWNDEDEPYPACILSRGRTGDQLCTRLGGNVDRWLGWPEVEKLKDSEK